METKSSGVAAEKSSKETLIEWLKAFSIALILVFIIHWLLFAPTVVSGPSMEPSLRDGDRLIVNKLIYRIREPERGELIVFHSPDGRDYIKRVIGLPGERIRISEGTVYIDNRPLKEDYIEDMIELYNQKKTDYNAPFSELVVPKRTVFAMGDNRPISQDSRSPLVGPIPYDEIVGRADAVFWPVSAIRWIHHGSDKEEP